MSSVTQNAEGQVTETTKEAPKITVSYSRKLGEGFKERYGNEEATVYVPVELHVDDSIESAAGAIRLAFAAAKTAVYEQLGLPSSVDPVTQVVMEDMERTLGATPVAPAAPVSNPVKRAPRATPKASTNGDKDAAWQDLVNNPDGWFDNRQDKRNPKAPDYKAKDKNKAFAGTGLWVDSAPDFVPSTLTAF